MPRLGQPELRPGFLEASCNSLCPGQVCGSGIGVTLPIGESPPINPAAGSSQSSHMVTKAACLEQG